MGLVAFTMHWATILQLLTALGHWEHDHCLTVFITTLALQILVLYGDDPIASNNILLGQFDITGIPPAPKDVPRIEVKGGTRRFLWLCCSTAGCPCASHDCCIPLTVLHLQVSFHLDKTAYLTVEARDLDTERHKLWQQRGQIVELKS